MDTSPRGRDSPGMGRTWLLVCVIVFDLIGASCGQSERRCIDDRTCGTGSRCDLQGGRSGVCIACAAVEIPYNGVDDDCDPRTRHFDLDGDGQNWDQAPVSPGLDCNDEDPTIYFGALEVCFDGVDRDCDGFGGPGQTEDPECFDQVAPTVRIESPVDGDRLVGEVAVRVAVTDDGGVRRLRLLANGVEVGERNLDEPVQSGSLEIAFDSRAVADGSTTLSVEGIDIADRTARANVRVLVDNLGPPDIEVLTPQEGQAYGGRLEVRVLVRDPDGLDPAGLEMALGGQPLSWVATSSSAFRATVNTATVAEGAATLAISATDRLGNRSDAEVVFFVDRTAPMGRFVLPAENERVEGEITVRIEAEDPSGVPGIEFFGETVRSTELERTLDTRTLPNGTFTLTATVSDQVVIDDEPRGNSVVLRRSVVVDNLDDFPTVRFRSPSPNDEVLGPTELQLDVSGGDSQNQLSVRVNGFLVGHRSRSPWTVVADLEEQAGPLVLEAEVRDGRNRVGRASLTLLQVAPPRLRLVRSTPPTAGTITDVQAVDFDGDGALDLVTAGAEVASYAGRVVGGRFRAQAPVPLSPSRVGRFRLADLDGDGDLDLIGTDGRSLFVYANDNGRLEVVPQQVPFPFNNQNRIAVADLDGDMIPEVVVAGGTQAAAYVYERDAGNYRLRQVLGGDGRVATIVLADVNGDGSLDVAVGRAGGRTISVFLNDGTGQFGAGLDDLADQPAETIAVGDVNGDGHADVIAGTRDGVEVLLGPWPTQMPRLRGASAALRGVAAADVDGDGQLEVLSIDDRAEAVLVWTVSSGELSVRDAYLVGGQTRQLAVSDLDGDGLPELLVVSGNRIAVFQNVAGTYQAPRATLLRFAAPSVDVGSLLGTPAPDLAIVNPTAGRIELWENRGGFRFTSEATLLPPAGVLGFDHVAVGQVDGAAGLDVAAVTRAQAGGPTRALYLDQGNGSFTPTFEMGDRAVGVFVVDLDGDGAGEVAFLRQSAMVDANGVDVTFASSEALERPLRRGQGALALASGRFSSGGPRELVVANGVSENLAVHRWTGTAYNSVVYNAPTGLGRVVAGSLRPMAADDIVGVAGERVFIMESSPALGFSPPVLTQVGRNLVEPQLLDVNGDGVLDVVVLADGTLYVLVRRPAGGFYPPLAYGYGTAGTRLLSADFDGDGVLDLLSVQPRASTLVVVPGR